MNVIDFEIACARCGSSLRGCDLDGTCPSCGRHVGQTLNLALIDAATMTVRDDVECVTCQYDLRTLSIASVCPECGTPVAKSLHMRELAFADFTWLNNVRRGTRYLLAAMLASLAFLLFPASAAISDFSIIVPIACLSIPILIIVIVIGLVVGLTAICSPQPDFIHPRYIQMLQTTCVVLFISAILLVLSGISMLSTYYGDVLIRSGVACIVGLFLCSAVSIHYLAAQARHRILRPLALLWVAVIPPLILLILLWSPNAPAWLANSQVNYNMVDPIAEYVLPTLAGICYLLGFTVLILCREMLTVFIRRQDQQADALIRQQMEHIQSQSQGAAETPQ